MARWLKHPINGGLDGHLERRREPVEEPRPKITRGDEIVLTHVFPPIPIRQFDWQASWDNDEPDDDGRMLTGHGPTPLAAIVDLLDNTEERS